MSLFTLVCYKESCNICDSLASLVQNHNVTDYAYILHDKDIDDNGEYKKAHYHLIIKLEFRDPNHSKKEQLEIASLFGLVGGQNGQIVRSEKSALLYLIHANDKSKYQYDCTNIVYYADYLSSVFSKALNDKEQNEENNFSTLFENVLMWIDSQNSCISWRQLLFYLRKEKLLVKCVAYMGILKDFIRYHNIDIDKNYADVEQENTISVNIGGISE